MTWLVLGAIYLVAGYFISLGIVQKAAPYESAGVQWTAAAIVTPIWPLIVLRNLGALL